MGREMGSNLVCIFFAVNKSWHVLVIYQENLTPYF